MSDCLPDIRAYVLNPCALLSLPHWKYRHQRVPPGVRVRHAKSWDKEVPTPASEEVFFRLLHRLQDIPLGDARFVPICLPQDAEELANHLCRCYVTEGIVVSPQDVLEWAKEPVYFPEGWIKLVNEEGQILAGGIAQADMEAREGILDWVQVDPTQQGQGLGSAVVQTLLHILSQHVDFVTVSGSLHNPNNPEALYRKNGFTGDDLWVVLRS